LVAKSRLSVNDTSNGDMFINYICQLLQVNYFVIFGTLLGISQKIKAQFLSPCQIEICFECSRN